MKKPSPALWLSDDKATWKSSWAGHFQLLVVMDPQMLDRVLLIDSNP
jgi:hypothetical protein